MLAAALSTWGLQPEIVPDARTLHARLDKADPKNRPIVLIDRRVADDPLIDRLSDQAGDNVSLIVMLTPTERQAAARGHGVPSGLVLLEKPVTQGDLLHALQRVTSHQEAPAPAPAASPAQNIQEPERSLRLLLAEDTPANQKLIAAILKKRGHGVSIASNGEEALRFLDSQEFDLVLMDVQMPVMDGFQTTSAIREREKTAGGRMPIVAMTAHAMQGDRERCLAAGMDAYIPKPINVAELIEVIENPALLRLGDREPLIR
jgi:CheY-like chemotaxis protein